MYRIILFIVYLLFFWSTIYLLFIYYILAIVLIVFQSQLEVLLEECESLKADRYTWGQVN